MTYTVQICLQQNRPNSAAMMLAIHAVLQLFNKTCMPKKDARMTTALGAPQSPGDKGGGEHAGTLPDNYWKGRGA